MEQNPKLSAKSTANDVIQGIDASGKYAIVTGGNTGIGYVTARELVKAGAHVVIGCRNLDKAKEAVAQIKNETGSKKIKAMKLDLTSLQQVREFAAKYKSKGYPLHYLINNAGIYAAQREETQDGFESHMGVNYLSPWVLTWELLDVLKSSAPSRVVNVSSFGFLQIKKVDWDDFNLHHEWGSFKAYATSKLFQVWHAAYLHERLFAKFGISAYALHPGRIRTQIFNQANWLLALVATAFGKSVDQGAATSVYAALRADPATEGGKYLDDCKMGEKSKLGADMQLARRAWEESAKLVGLDIASVDEILDE